MNCKQRPTLAVMPMPSLGSELADSYLRLAEEYTKPTERLYGVAAWALAQHDTQWIDDAVMARLSDDRLGIETMVAARDDALTRLNCQAAARARALFAKLGVDVSQCVTDFMCASAVYTYESSMSVEVEACAGLHVGQLAPFLSTADPVSTHLAKAIIQCVVRDSDGLIEQAEAVVGSMGMMAEDIIAEHLDEEWEALFDYYEANGWPEQEDAFSALLDLRFGEYDEMSDDDLFNMRERLSTLLGTKYGLIEIEASLWDYATLEAMTTATLRSIASTADTSHPRSARLKQKALMVAHVLEQTPMDELGTQSYSAAPILISACNSAEGELEDYHEMILQSDEPPQMSIERGHDESNGDFIERVSRVLVAAHARGLMLEVLAHEGMFDAVENEDTAHATEHESEHPRIAV